MQKEERHGVSEIDGDAGEQNRERLGSLKKVQSHIQSTAVTNSSYLQHSLSPGRDFALSNFRRVSLANMYRLRRRRNP